VLPVRSRRSRPASVGATTAAARRGMESDRGRPDHRPSPLVPGSPIGPGARDRRRL